VSLLSPDTLWLYIEPTRIQAVKAVGLAQRAGEVRQRKAAVHAADNWNGMVEVCTELVRQTDVKRVRVVLSDKLARYACFAWRPELRNAEEELAMAQLQFDDIYGPNSSADWKLALSAGRPGQSRLSVAIPQSLFAALQTNFGLDKAPVASIQTALTATLRKHRKILGPTGWLINLEFGRLTMGSWQDGSWRWIYSAHTDVATPEALLARVRQEIKMSSTSLKPNAPLAIFVHAPSFDKLPLGTIEGVHLMQLKTHNASAGSKYAFALLGVKA
jgi:hypothetical protein